LVLFFFCAMVVSLLILCKIDFFSWVKLVLLEFMTIGLSNAFFLSLFALLF
jgi:hypothetical protein